MTLLPQLAATVEQGDVDRVVDLTQQAIDQGISPQKIIDEGLTKGIKRVGDSFAKEELFLCDLMMSAEAIQEALKLVTPLLKVHPSNQKEKARILLGTVAGDIHDIGKNIVVATLMAEGFEVIDLGYDVPSEKFINAIKEHHPHVLGLSALLTVTRAKMKEVIDLIKLNNLQSQVKVVVGGAITSQEFADNIGADAYAADAFDGVKIIKAIIHEEGL